MIQQLQTSNGNFLAVKLPVDARQLEIKPVSEYKESGDTHSFGVIFRYGKYNNFGFTDLETKDGIELIGPVSSTTEEQAKTIVEEVIIETEVPTRIAPLRTYMFRNYLSKNQYADAFHSPLESFHSWLKANHIYSENPYGNKPQCKVRCNCSEEQQHDCLGDIVLWDTAEKSVGNWILLKLLK